VLDNGTYGRSDRGVQHHPNHRITHTQPVMGSLPFLLWAVHRWSRHSRFAYLVAPLIIAASIATIVVFGSALI
jgi:hypothetical protein